MGHAKLIAVRMEEARDARGTSVAELARRASIDRKRLWYILDGQRQMRADEFVRLCAVMGLRPRSASMSSLRWLFAALSTAAWGLQSRGNSG